MTLVRLVGALRDELTADFWRYYGLSLGRVLADRGQGGSPPARELGAMAINLPRGCAVGQAVGGAWAVTAEVDAIHLVEFRMRDVWHAYTKGKGKKPEPMPYPVGWLTAQQKQASKEQKFMSKRDKWQASQRARREALDAYAKGHEVAAPEGAGNKLM